MTATYSAPVSPRLADLFVIDSDGPLPLRRTVEGTAIHRRRLLAAIVCAVADNGYQATTVADIVSLARVSRRTFYEQFTSKDECFLVAFEAFSTSLLHDIADAVATKEGWTQRLVAGIDAYVGGIFTDLTAARVFMLEVFSAGPGALARRRALHLQWATMIRDEILAARHGIPELAQVVHEMTLEDTNCIVGGVTDATQAMLEDAGTPDPTTLRRIALRLHISMSLKAGDVYLDLLD